MVYHRSLYLVRDFSRIIPLQFHHLFAHLASRLIVMLMILSCNVSFTPHKDEAIVRDRLESCISELRVWMNRNRLKLNDQIVEVYMLVF